MRRNGDRGLVGGDREILDRGYGFHRTGDRWLPDRWLGIPGSGTVTPPQIPETVPGLIRWWKADALPVVADGTRIALWPDSSTSKKDAAQTNPAAQPAYYSNVLSHLVREAAERAEPLSTDETKSLSVKELRDMPEPFMGGHPVLQFDAGYYMNFPDVPLTSEITLIAVGIRYGGQLVYLSGNSGQPAPEVVDDNGWTYISTNAGVRYQTPNVSITSAPAIWTCVIGASMASLIALYNGNDTGFLGAGGWPAGPVLNYLGIRGDLSTSQGHIGELILYNRVLTPQEWMTVGKYLGDKYNIPMPPSGVYAGAPEIDKSETGGITANDDMHGGVIFQGFGQSYISTGGKLARAEFPAYLFSGASGNATAKLWTRSANLPGTLLATSLPTDIGAYPKNAGTTVAFNFTGTNQYFLISGKEYFITVDYAGGDGWLVSLASSTAYAGQGVRKMSGAWVGSEDFPYTVKVVKPAGFTPKDVPNCTGWWEADFAPPVADGAPVPTIPDRSGNNNHAIGGTGTFYHPVGMGAKPYVECIPGGWNLTTPISGAGPWTVFGLYFPTGPCVPLGDAGKNTLDAGGYYPAALWIGTREYLFQGAGMTGNWHITTALQAAGNTEVKLWLDGAPSGLNPVGPNDGTGDFNAIFKKNNSSGSGYWVVTIAYNRRLTDAEIRQVQQYMADKYGITLATLREVAAKEIKKKIIKAGMVIGTMPGPKPPTK